MKEKDKKELMVKKAFVLYPDQWPALSNLSAQKLGLLFEAIFRTLRGEQGATLKLDGKVKLAYDFMMNQINLDAEKWEKAKEQHRVRQQRYRQKKNVTSRDVSPFKDKVEDKEEVEVEGKVEVEDKVEGTTSFVGSVENSGKAAIGISDTANSQKEAAAGPKDLEFFERVFKPYVNNIIRDSNIPPIRKITPERYEKILKLREQYTSDDIYRVFQIAARSDFLNERGRKHKFQATFDWLIEPENFLRVLEGTYR